MISGYKAGWPGLVRITFWTILFLVLFDMALKEGPVPLPFSQISGAQITPMLTYPDNPLLVREDTLPHYEKNIAWIGGSDSVVYPDDDRFDLETMPMDKMKLLPGSVLTSLENNYNTQAGMYLYLRYSLRMLDSYTLAAESLTHKPDLVVLVLNPFWIANEYAITRSYEFFPKATDIWSKDAWTWPWLFLFSEPGDHLWQKAGKKFTVLRMAGRHGTDTNDFREAMWNKIFPALSFTAGAEEKEENAVLPTLKSRALLFWVVNHQLNGDVKKIVNPDMTLELQAWNSSVMKLNNPQVGNFSWDVLLKTLALLEESKVPAILYLAPVSDKLRQDPEAWDKYNKVKEALARLSEDYKDSNVRIIAEIPEKYRKNVSFFKNDLLHVTSVKGYDLFLARQIEEALKNEKN